MKKLFTFLFLVSFYASAQRADYSVETQYSNVSLVPNPVDLHLNKYEDQYKTGKAFLWTGAVIHAVSAGIVAMNDKNPKLGMATGIIGGAFQLFGFINIVDSHRHQKKAWAAERTAIK